MDSQFNQYVPVLMLLGAALLLSVGMLVVSVLVGKTGRRPKAKDTAYECGMIPTGAPVPRGLIKFHVVAMLFLLFDVAVVFLYPWGVVYRSLLNEPATAGSAFLGILVFTVVIAVGYVYAVKKGAFDWRD